jgi:preprotein translocase subunit YajC
MDLLIPFAVVAVFLLLRANPQRQRVMAQRALLNELGAGERVVTASGLIGTVVATDGERTSLEVAPGVVVDFLTPAIVRRYEEPQPEIAYDDPDPDADPDVSGGGGGTDRSGGDGPAPGIDPFAADRAHTPDAPRPPDDADPAGPAAPSVPDADPLASHPEEI